MNDFRHTIMPYVVNYGLNILFAIIILVVGWVVASWVKTKILHKGEKSPRLDATLTRLFAQVAKILIMTFVIIAILNRFGVQTASIIAVIGGIGLAIGLAWQGVLADFAAGIMILVTRPFRIGESIAFGSASGVVDEIGIIWTDMHTFDNLAMTVPNSEIWGHIITNYTTNANRRVDMVFGFGYDDNMDQAMKIAREVLEADERVLTEPEPLIAIAELADSSVNMRVRPWTAKENYWALTYDITKRMKERFDEAGLNIPYPQHDVHFMNEDNQ